MDSEPTPSAAEDPAAQTAASDASLVRLQTRAAQRVRGDNGRFIRVAPELDATLDEGVYCQFRGPHYETPAEVQMAKAIGGHIVGMSTALEAIAAREAGMEVLGLSLITNLAAGIQKTPLSHTEVLEAGKQAEPVIADLLARVVTALGQPAS